MSLTGKCNCRAPVEVAPNWVASLLGLHEGRPIPAYHLEKAKTLLESLVTSGQGPLAADLDRQIAAQQRAAAAAAQPKKPWWRVW